MNITKKLEQAIQQAVQREVYIQENLSVSHMIRDVTSYQPIPRAYCSKFMFKLEYTAQHYASDTETVRKDIVKMMKKDLYGEFRYELLRILGTAYEEGVTNRKVLDAINSLVDEIS